ncbi:MAG: GNAT family N-acetyltransferase [Candidatus Acidiferrales bacterium]
MSQVTFRPAAKGDEADLLRMMRSLAEQEPGAYYFDEPAVRSVLRQFLADPSLGRAWIFSDATTIAGYIVLTLGYSFEYHGRDAFVDELYVEPQYRRRGIGREAMKFVEAEARTMGVTALHLEVDEGNDPALELYRRSGYVDHDRHLMTKWLVAQTSR